MPFSIIPKLPLIARALKEDGYLDFIPLQALRKHIKLMTGVYTDKGIAVVIENLIEFNYIKHDATGNFEFVKEEKEKEYAKDSAVLLSKLIKDK